MNIEEGKEFQMVGAAMRSNGKSSSRFL